MNLYPALRAHMGNWVYYIVKMAMKDIVKEVGFASEVYENKTLDDAIQRTLNEGRVKREIVRYLALREDRFFSSIVVAALGGNPTFTPVEITADPKFSLFKIGGLDEAFGILTFDGGQQYFALDGQHRLKSIKTLIEGNESDAPEVPQDFHDEEISVIMLVRQEEDDDEFLRRYRRVFSGLNRYAKATDRDTNIIMDEDDVTAILTRRLLTEHGFFKWAGKPNTSSKLKTKGKNVRAGESYFTSLQTLYEINEILLSTPTREQGGVFKKESKQFRLPEDELEAMYEELVCYWDALLDGVDVLKSDPAKMRKHDIEQQDEDGLMSHLLFLPIGQEMFMRVFRVLLNRRLKNVDSPDRLEITDCASVLSKVDWNLRSPPWVGLLLVQNPTSGKWAVRNEDRKDAVKIGVEILRWQTGVDALDKDGIRDLKVRWYAMLSPVPTKADVDRAWSSVKIVSEDVKV